jgi:hypothetical protein
MSGKHKENEEFAKIDQLSPQFSSVEQVWARQDFLTSTGGILGRVFRKNVTLILSFNQIYLTKRFLTFFSFSKVLK